MEMSTAPGWRQWIWLLVGAIIPILTTVLWMSLISLDLRYAFLISLSTLLGVGWFQKDLFIPVWWKAICLSLPICLAYLFLVLPELPGLWLVLPIFVVAVGSILMIRRTNFRLPVVLGIGLTGVLVAFLVFPSIISRNLSTELDLTAPDFKLQGLIPVQTISKQDLSGKVVVLSFFGTWCAPCIAEMAEMEAVKATLAKQESRLEFIIACTDQGGDTPEKAERFMEKRKLPFQLAFDPKSTAHRAFGFSGVPGLIILDQKGNIRLRHEGYNQAENLREYLIPILERLLATDKRLVSPNATPARAENKGSLLASEQLAKDSIWFKAYHLFYQQQIRPEVSRVLETLAIRHNMEQSQVSFFNMIVQHYACDQIDLKHYLIKYPFAKSAFVQEQFEQLIRVGLLQETFGKYRLSEYGRKVRAELDENFRNISVEINQGIIDLLQKVVIKASDSNFPGINLSLQLRQSACLRLADTTNTFVQFMTVMDDLVALRNDQSHYRYQLLTADKQLQPPELSPAATEILATISYRGQFSAGDFADRPTWGHLPAESQVFIDELLGYGLVIKQNKSYILTPKGASLERTASTRLEATFYAPWQFMNEQEYTILQSALNDADHAD